MRINKFLAECGVASRRSSEQIIKDGRVKVNNKVVTNLATVIDTEKDKVLLDDKRLQMIHKHLYLALNKPKGCVSTTSDEKDRKTVLDFLPKKYQKNRVYPVGRLDYETEGLILLTTDGDIANKIMHPKNEIEKTYIVRIEGDIEDRDIEKLKAGIELDGSLTKPCKIKKLEIITEDDKSENQKIVETRLEMTITEGRNRQVRRMIEFVNKTIIYLKRTAIGEIKLGGLSRGEVRELRQKEIDFLRSL